MSTYGEVVSRIQNNLNALTKDTFIPRRFILSVLKSKGGFLMAQKFNDKSIFRETNIFKWVECVKMERIDSIKCGKVELAQCGTLMKSRKKLPGLIWSRYGSSLSMVLNMDSSKKYEILTPQQYIVLSKLESFNKFRGGYAIIYPDGHLYIPDSTVKIVNLFLFTLDDEDISECDDKNECRNYWDTEFTISTKVEEVAIQETLKEVMMRVQIPRDENPNLDSNQKSATQE